MASLQPLEYTTLPPEHPKRKSRRHSTQHRQFSDFQTSPTPPNAPLWKRPGVLWSVIAVLGVLVVILVILVAGGGDGTAASPGTGSSSGNAPAAPSPAQPPTPVPIPTQNGTSSTTIAGPVVTPVPSVAPPTVAPPVLPPTPPCTHFASPSGGGTGAAATAPFLISDFWNVASPGSVLCLVNGTYVGADSMIVPPASLSGTAGSPITVQAQTDGGVLLDGEYANVPVDIDGDFWHIRGINACRSRRSVYMVGGDDVSFFRCVGWDAADGNNNIFGTHGNVRTLFEDCAGWGICRKVFSCSQNGNDCTLRRIFSRWDGSHVIGPKISVTMAYNNYGMTMESSIVTWAGNAMNETYTVRNYDFSPASPPQTFTDHDVFYAYALVGVDRQDDETITNSAVMGSLVYARNSDRLPTEIIGGIMGGRATDKAYFSNVTVILGSDHSHVPPLRLYRFDGGAGKGLDCPVCDRRFESSTVVGTGTSSIATGENGWTLENVVQTDDMSKAPNPFNGAGPDGSRMCYRIVDRQLTNEPLWPWPMDHRIKDAMEVSGYPSVTRGLDNDDGLITTSVQDLMGDIPTECRSN